MAIRRHIQYDAGQRKMRGFVDLGDGPDESTVASEALVFMVVGLQSYWKAPIAFFITRTLSPQTQRILLEHTLHALHQRGIKVVCLTMDGHASNISMVTSMGCNLKVTEEGLSTPLKTSFSHPASGEPIYVIMDACHMLKLCRNMFDAYSPLTNEEGSLSWDFLIDLNNVQVQEGLHAANKLTQKHLDFSNQKMKVRLAAQVFSQSVANAMQLLKDLGHEKFHGCSPTVKFIKVINFIGC